MAPIDITLTPGNLPPNPCYSNEQARFNAYIQATQATLPINFTTVIVSTAAPGPDDRNKIWVQVDGNNRIIAINTFANGQWESINPTSPYINIGEVRMYDPTLYTPAAPWYPMDGSIAGVANVQGMFPVCAGHRTLTAAQIAAGETATVFTSGTPGGAEQNTLPATAMPPHVHPTLSGDGSFCIDGGTKPPPSGDLSGGGNLVSEQATTGTAGGIFNAVTGLYTTGTFSCLPPYFPMAFMQWRPDLV